MLDYVMLETSAARRMDCLAGHERIARGGRKSTREWGVQLFVAGITVLSFLWVYLAGKDLTWDALNYHVYAPHSLVQGRIAQDFFAASVQGFLNPVGYLPFYLMLRVGLPSWLVAGLLTIIHVINVYLVFRLSRQLFEGFSSRHTYVFLAVALAFSSSLYWSLVGSSFLDLMVTLPMLAALCLLAGSGVNVRRAVLAGVCMGAAVGLKLSCAVFAVPGIAFLYSKERNVMLTNMGVYVVGGIVGFLLLYGYWGSLLWNEFGNPFFPFFNALFQSAAFPPESINILRYVPSSLSEHLQFPFRVALPAYWTYSELMNPDIKLLAVWVLLIILSIIAALSAIRKGKEGGALRFQAFIPLTAFWVFSYFGWTLTSGAGRYGLLLLLLAGPLVMLLLHRLWPRRSVLVATVILIVQGVTLAIAGVPRWGEGSSWNGEWIEFEVPRQLRDVPALYLSAGRNSMSFLSLEIHPVSAMVNVSGQYALALDAPGGDRLDKLFKRYQEVRSLIPFEVDFERAMAGGEVHAAQIYDEYQSSVYGRFGYEVAGDCLFIRQRAARDVTKTMLSCRLRPSPMALAKYQAELDTVADVFSRVEASCGTLLRPVGGAAEQMPFGWQKFYLNTDTKLKIVDEVVLLQRPRAVNPLMLGSVEDVRSGMFNKVFSCE